MVSSNYYIVQANPSLTSKPLSPAPFSSVSSTSTQKSTNTASESLSNSTSVRSVFSTLTQTFSTSATTSIPTSIRDPSSTNAITPTATRPMTSTSTSSDPAVTFTPGKSTHTAAIIGGAAGGAVALVIFSALALYCLRSGESGGQEGRSLTRPVAPVPQGSRPSAGPQNSGTDRRGSGYDNPPSDPANPRSVSPPISFNMAGIGSGSPWLVNLGRNPRHPTGRMGSQDVRGVSFPDSSIPRNVTRPEWRPGEGPTVQMSIARPVPHPAPDDTPEYSYGSSDTS
ncbi:uncharacterized protein EI90DRAFT_1795530 [Cantharellus anzutake]|uniref:uncharacterized protein n=1 Tax=Cantharellus anzutake TaxID=1750568 RepID=UPI001904D44F|nr:uncharacterized protein EI90DRAFT_1795530 [Cantharellus anzutake]KAF8327462.1 hypothetical protein EI90DRAFT_1795530 [Cantharellus anzutake]